MTQALPLVLASSSPRRQELLRRLGLEVVVAPTKVEESFQDAELAVNVPLRLAEAKAHEAQDRHPFWPVLAADTAVVLNGRVFGKPATRAEAEATLQALKGRTHLVVTAVVVGYLDRWAQLVDVAKVTFAPFPPDLLSWYLAGEEWRDKAGAYAIQGQGAMFVEKVHGNVQAVVGLPLAPLPRIFAQVGLQLKPEGNRFRLVPRNEWAPPTPGERNWQRCGGR